MPEQHNGLPVAGYRPQSDEKVALVNSFKHDEERLLRKLDALVTRSVREATQEGGLTIDGRWLSIGRTHLEQAFMAINRSVFQPSRAALPEDSE